MQHGEMLAVCAGRQRSAAVAVALLAQALLDHGGGEAVQPHVPQRRDQVRAYDHAVAVVRRRGHHLRVILKPFLQERAHRDILRHSQPLFRLRVQKRV